MSTNSFKIKKSVVVDPQAGSVVSEKGEIAYNVATDKYEGYTSSADPIVQEAKTSTLTNKNLGNSNNTLSGATAATLVSGAGTLTLNTSGTTTVPNATDTLVGKDTTDILTNKSISGSTNTVTNVSLTTGVTGTLPATNGGTAQSTYTTGDTLYASASNTLSKLPAGTANQVLKTVGGIPSWQVESAGGVNYLSSNPNAEVDTTGWSTYADAAQNIPVDGTGGAPNSTWTRTPTTPLRGTGSFLWTKSGAANRQGEGVGYAFTIDAADKAKVLSVSFDYLIDTGTFTASNASTAPLNDGTTSTNAGNSDLEAFLYDVTNAALIPISPAVLISNSSTTPSTFKAIFQTAPNSTSYRLIIHTATATTNNFTVKFDNFSVGPQVVANGVIPKANTKQIFSSGSGTYTTPSNVLAIRVIAIGAGGGGGGSATSGGGNGGTGGDTTFSSYTASGGGGGAVGTGSSGSGGGGTPNANSGSPSVSLLGGPGGTAVYATASTTTPVGGSGGNGVFGGGGAGGTPASAGTFTGSTNTGGGGGGAIGDTATRFAGGGGASGSYFEQIITSPSATYSYGVGAAGAAGAAGTGVAGYAGGSGYLIVEEFYNGANVLFSNDAATRVVAASVANTAGTSIPTGTDTAVPYATTTYDTHSAFSGSSFTAPVSGYYRLTTTQTWDSANFLNVVLDLMFKKNGSTVVARTLLYPQTSTGLSWSQTLSQTIKLNAGEYAGVYVAQSSGGSRTLLTGTGTNVFAVEQVQGPSNISSVETVALSYSRTASQSISNITPTYIIWTSKYHDTHNSMNTSTGEITIPVSGIYTISSMLEMDQNATGRRQFTLNKNGSDFYNFANSNGIGGPVSNQIVQGIISLPLLAGDKLKVYLFQDSGGSLNATPNGASFSNINVNRVGN